MIARRIAARLAGACLVWGLAAPVGAQAPAAEPSTAAEADTGDTTITAALLSRVERWRYFTPHLVDAGEPDYTFLGSRASLGVRHREGRWDARATLHYVRIEPLPSQAIGPGVLGSGGLYQFHAQGTFSYQLYVPELALGVDVAPGVTVTVGRFPYTSGGEAPAAASVAAVRPRVEGRLLGAFPWSMYGRAFDGVRLDVTRPSWRAHAAAMMPTQGGYEESASIGMHEVKVGGASLAWTGRPSSETQAFAYGYRDTRRVPVRPDNTRRAAAEADVTVWTAGVSHLAVVPVPSGALDLVLWMAGQAGQWYELDHRAWSAAAEFGHRWTRVPGRPWLRAGLLAASGDDEAGDGRHGTFFPMLPSVDGQSASTVYAPMNLVDVFAEARVEPHARLRVSGAVHHLSLRSAADRWYAGSGATGREGAYFGYSTRASGGATGLGTIVEGTADLSLSRHWTVNAYLGHMRGGDIVRHSFSGDRLTFVAITSVIRF
ncbi:MAG: alginate export family protein [Vicinamibacterales bacterium]|nr:alginate export family protein [Vicinamibacterales bacterium]